MSKKENNNNEQQPKRNHAWLWILIIGVALISGYCYWQNMKQEEYDTFSYPEYWQDSTENKIDSAKDVVLDTMMTETKELTEKSANRTSSHQSSSSYSNDDDDDDLFNDPEYCEGGKYDPALYHTDYGRDEEQRRRDFIDNDGYDDVDGYDEYYGYQHEYERSAQWKK